ncbi:hypothetical protein QFC20_002218 [Naganishia adeliensis]|uniref:Uncharacterized protein n=1 Tax=Naganishia adeliensis TaxID=92952 RepID=A0ACC2WM64_9TREE|nr:hypothetical protein QFC20_002218 [Naganishia adeliensis]
MPIEVSVASRDMLGVEREEEGQGGGQGDITIRVRPELICYFDFIECVFPDSGNFLCDNEASSNMANSRFEYVRNFELPDPLLPSTHLVVRIDGKGFHRFSDAHGFVKPNDKPALDLMDRAAQRVFEEVPDVVVGFGESDEYSFLIRKDSTLYNRRESKIVTLIVSCFTSAYVFYWPHYMPSTRPLQYPPIFDGRIVQYPSEALVKDYFRWRAVDTHINNLYNTTFWALVLQGGQTPTEANQTLSGTVSGDKNEILFKRFGINYSTLPEQFRRGSTIVRKEGFNNDLDVPATTPPADPRHASNPLFGHKQKKKPRPVPPYDGTNGVVQVVHVDMVKDGFWDDRPWLLQLVEVRSRVVEGKYVEHVDGVSTIVVVCIPPNLTFSTRGRRAPGTSSAYSPLASNEAETPPFHHEPLRDYSHTSKIQGIPDGERRTDGRGGRESPRLRITMRGMAGTGRAIGRRVSGPPEGKASEVDRYIEGVLSGVAEAKAAREKTAEEVAAVEQVEERAAYEVLPGDDHGKDEIVADSAADTSAERSQPALSSPSVLASTIPTAAPSSSTPGKSPPFSKADMSLLAKKLQNRLDEEIRRLKMQKESVKQSLTLRAREFGKDAQVQFGLLGGKVNEVTGYSEIERLKQDVRERENDIARLREEAAQAKDAYDQAVTSRSVSQRDLNSLLERKHNWTDADISRFTHLVRSDHTLNHAVTSSKEALKRAESEVDKAFTALLKSILERYHEEQVWSDKIRSVSTYGSLIVLLINLIVFLGAIAIVEPWKRRRLVRGLEERVKGMVDDVEHTVTDEFELVKSNMASVAATLSELQAALADDSAVDRIHHAFAKQERHQDPEPTTMGEQAPNTSAPRLLAGQSAPHESSLLPSSTLPLLSKISSAAASFVGEQDPHRVDMAIVGTAGLIAGAAVTFLITTFR